MDKRAALGAIGFIIVSVASFVVAGYLWAWIAYGFPISLPGAVSCALGIVALVPGVMTVIGRPRRWFDPRSSVGDVVFWDSPDKDGTLYWHDREEAIENLIEERAYIEITANSPIEVVAYRRPKIRLDEGFVLEMLLENYLDEEYAGEGGPTVPTEAMKRAEREFISVIEREYEPWICEEVPGTKQTVNSLDWISEHRPEWLCKTEEEHDDATDTLEGGRPVLAATPDHRIHLHD